MPRQLRVFLCHASQDKPIVRELYQRLKAENWIDPWLDKAKLLPGQDWELVIEKAVDDSDVVIVCLSSQSVSKEGFVQREIRYAYDLALEKPEDTIFLIPLRLDDCAMPRKLRSYHWVDYFGKEKKNSYSDLLQALKLRYDQKLQMEETQSQEEPKAEIPEKQPEKRFTQRKPYTKILDPSSLNPTPVEKNRSQLDYRRFGLIGIILLLFILGGFGLNSLFNQSPKVTSTSASQIFSETPKPPTKTSMSFTPPLTNTPNPSHTPTLGIGSTMISEKDGMVMAYVPAGGFNMGSDSINLDEHPIHQVRLSAFWIDQTEITNEMYKKCVDTGACKLPGNTKRYNNPGYTDHPVVFVFWNDATAYCTWAGRRLPSEAEWEKAARGVEEFSYPWGEEIDCERANYNGLCVGDTTSVKSYSLGMNSYGTYDMTGNVWEWVSSLYKPYPYDPNDGREDMSIVGSRVLRGGSWRDFGFDVRSTARFVYNPNYPYDSIGFRCALSQP